MFNKIFPQSEAINNLMVVSFLLYQQNC